MGGGGSVSEQRRSQRDECDSRLVSVVRVPPSDTLGLAFTGNFCFSSRKCYQIRKTNENDNVSWELFIQNRESPERLDFFS